MTPEFAKAVDPVFLHMLGLLERIERGETPVLQQERAQIRALLDRTENLLGRQRETELAKYALVAWIDEVLLEMPWQGREWWENNALEAELFHSRLRHEQFYSKAQEAGTLLKHDALEVFYLCVVLGFRGLYRDPATATMLADARRLPPNLQSWARQTATAIQLRQGRPPLDEGGDSGRGAPPLSGQARLIWTSLVSVVLAACTVLVTIYLFLR